MSGRPERALVLGGSGALGRAVVAELRAAGTRVAFTFCSGRAVAHELEARFGAHAYAADLLARDAVRDLFERLAADGRLPGAVIHCAGRAPTTALDDVTPEAWDALQAIHGRAALACAQEMVRRGLRGSLVLVAALDGIEPVPAPAHYAASQGALRGLMLALAKEIGPRGILVNLAAVGALDAGISESLAPELRSSYERHAALGRTGSCEEAARAIRWLALENTYMNGAVLPVSGGLP